MENPSKVGAKLENSSKGLKNAFHHIIKLAKKLKNVKIINDTFFYVFGVKE